MYFLPKAWSRENWDELEGARALVDGRDDPFIDTTSAEKILTWCSMGDCVLVLNIDKVSCTLAIEVVSAPD